LHAAPAASGSVADRQRAFAGGVFLAGCRPVENWERVAVNGTASLDGKPIALAALELAPSNGAAGPASGGEIRDGRFNIPVEKGPTTGDYMATITIFRAPGKDLTGGDAQSKSSSDDQFTVPLKLVSGRNNVTLKLPLESDSAK